MMTPDQVMEWIKVGFAMMGLVTISLFLGVLLYAMIKDFQK
jgi:hypothetical protein